MEKPLLPLQSSAELEDQGMAEAAPQELGEPAVAFERDADVVIRDAEDYGTLDLAVHCVLSHIGRRDKVGVIH